MVIVISFFEAIFSLLCVMMGISNPSWFTGIVLSSRPHTALCVCVQHWLYTCTRFYLLITFEYIFVLLVTMVRTLS